MVYVDFNGLFGRNNDVNGFSFGSYFLDRFGLRRRERVFLHELSERNVFRLRFGFNCRDGFGSFSDFDYSFSLFQND